MALKCYNERFNFCSGKASFPCKLNSNLKQVECPYGSQCYVNSNFEFFYLNKILTFFIFKSLSSIRSIIDPFSGRINSFFHKIRTCSGINHSCNEPRAKCCSTPLCN